MVAHRVRRRTVQVLLAGCLVVGGAGVAGCGGVDVAGAPVERKVFPFDGSTLTVDAGDSDVELVPADVADVEVARQVDGWVVAGNGPDASWSLEDGTLTLRVRCEALVENCGARHEVRVPRGVAVTLRGDNGTVTADGFTAALTLRTDNGDLAVRDARGPLDLSSDNGTLRVEGAASKTVTARSENGDVHLALRAAPERVEARSENGGVVVELPAGSGPYAVDAGSGNGDVRADLPRDPASARSVTARSENGDVTVRTAN
ncbi:DUF4097 family beta strand repeat-containing protein [Streptomyces sp. DH12]|uniref:DUF4097 family beta strand repeat-containing protein n=1 Tax=Streptomyces sp. DH12 TaxID=2857010 RepID=UPI001E2D8DF3|nr:DUF4097 family beta strand repeat-containing protein [Streptomyces sp. DH12]